MRLPKMRPRPAMELRVPDLGGGMNLRDGLSEILDNQLTDCKNLWWQDGLLKTRPGFNETEAIRIDGSQEENVWDADVKKHNCFYDKDGVKGQLCSVKTFVYEEMENKTYINFFWLFGNSQTALPVLFINGTDLKYFVCRHKNFLYCYVNNRNIYKLDITDSESVWKEVEESEKYSPIVLSECKASDYIAQSAETVISSGVMVEGYNILGNSYRVQYTAFNPDIAEQTTDQMSDEKYWHHQMRYFLPESAEDLKGKTIIVKHTNNSGTSEHKITFSTSTKTVVSEGKLHKTDSLNLCGCGNEIWFNQELENTANPYYINDYEEGYRNNIEVTIPYKATDEEYNKIFNMTQCEWFGGAATGIAGGTRLFLCGNESEPSLVVWSGLNKPLYFPENAYFYVGDTTSAVTGFGKQSDMLVIFKENETWYTKYQQNTEITAEDLINQTVIDYASSSVYFPLVQINPNIGCAYPDTIQLCRNRLVWLDSGGKVYTLVSENQYNERSIFCVSEMIKSKIAETEELYALENNGAVACDWNGYYCLVLKGCWIYLMDYNCYGYTHISSYSKTEDANVRIPWYLWEVPFGGTFFAIGDILTAASRKAKSTYFSNVSFFNSLGGQCDTLSDGEHEIHSSMQTKLFDFGQPSVRKNVDRINLQLGNNDGRVIKVTIVTENGNEEAEIMLDGTEAQSYTAGYIDSKAIFPCIRQVLRLGVRLESNGVLAVDGMSFKYRLGGSAR